MLQSMRSLESDTSECTLSHPATSRARTLEAGKGLARLAQARAASRPGLCTIEPGRRSGAPPVWMDVVDAIAGTPTGFQDRPVKEQRIRKATVDTFGEPYKVEKYCFTVTCVILPDCSKPF